MDMTLTEEKSAKLKVGYNVWNSLTPTQRWEKVMKHFTPEERKGVSGLRRMAQYIVDNGVTA